MGAARPEGARDPDQTVLKIRDQDPENRPAKGIGPSRVNGASHGADGRCLPGNVTPVTFVRSPKRFRLNGFLSGPLSLRYRVLVQSHGVLEAVGETQYIATSQSTLGLLDLDWITAPSDGLVNCLLC